MFQNLLNILIIIVVNLINRRMIAWNLFVVVKNLLVEAV